ncbi:MAG: hypothetical protein P8J86_08580 [Phycisphaerales bacterium]|nr:hypothetical protein [Phycisphaerales bacterium]
MTHIRSSWIMLPIALLVITVSARADLGTVRDTKTIEGYDLTLFSSPEPFRAGPVDISVMVANHDTGQTIVDCQIEILLTPTFDGPAAFHVPATRENAQNQLLQAALFEIPEPGQWKVTARVTGLSGISQPIELTALVDAFPHLPRWRSIWLWLVLPIIALVVYVFNQICAASRKQRHKRRSMESK